MLANNLPNKIQLPFANNAGQGYKNSIPVASQISTTPGAASFTDGFPPLTMTPLAAGGVPPAGADFNGILYAITTVQQWQSAGGLFPFDSAFATAINGYPKGAVLLNGTKDGCWLNTTDSNTTNPDATDGSAAGWVPVSTYGIANIALTSGTVTLTPAQYCRKFLVLTGALTANVQLIVPAIMVDWYVVNNTTGNYTVTIKTAAGTGVTVQQNIALTVWGDGTNVNVRGFNYTDPSLSATAFNPMLYGAKGDGTTDDTTALNNCFAAAAGHAVFLPARDFYFTGMLTIPANTLVFGAGYGSRLHPNNTGGNTVQVGANVTLKDLRLDGSSPGGFMVNGGASNVIFDRIYFRSVGQCVWLFACDKVTVKSCIFDSTGYGVIQQNGNVSNNVIIDGNVAFNMTADFVEANCTNTAPSQSWNLTNNIYLGANGYPTAATEKRFAGFTSVQDVLIQNNLIQKVCGDAAIHLEDTLGDYIIDGNVLDNIVVGGGNDGYIYILNSQKSVLVSNNTFKRTDTALTGGVFALSTNSNNYSNEILFTGNRIIGTGASGSQNLSGLDIAYHNNALITGNIFDNCFEAMNNAAAVGTQFSNNRVLNCNSGLSMVVNASSGAGTDWEIHGNVFSGTPAGNYDVYMPENSSGTGEAQRVSIKNNHFVGKVLVGGNPGGPYADDVTVINNRFNAYADLDVSQTTHCRRGFNQYGDKTTIEPIYPATAVTAAPEYVGQMAVVSGKVYFAQNTTASTDWLVLN